MFGEGVTDPQGEAGNVLQPSHFKGFEIQFHFITITISHFLLFVFLCHSLLACNIYDLFLFTDDLWKGII
jgi:hypothetical protein